MTRKMPSALAGLPCGLGGGLLNDLVRSQVNEETRKMKKRHEQYVRGDGLEPSLAAGVSALRDRGLCGESAAKRGSVTVHGRGVSATVTFDNDDTSEAVAQRLVDEIRIIDTSAVRAVNWACVAEERETTHDTPPDTVTLAGRKAHPVSVVVVR